MSQVEEGGGSGFNLTLLAALVGKLRVKFALMVMRLQAAWGQEVELLLEHAGKYKTHPSIIVQYSCCNTAADDGYKHLMCSPVSCLQVRYLWVSRLLQCSGSGAL
jgi:hypothetical protein